MTSRAAMMLPLLLIATVWCLVLVAKPFQKVELRAYSRFSMPPPYEASDAAALGDGKILVVDDESDHPLSLVKLSEHGTLEAEAISPKKQFEKNGAYAAIRSLQDLEGATAAPDGRIYLISSFSRKVSGHSNPKRDKLLSFELKDGKISNPLIRTDLREALRAIDPLLAKAADEDAYETPQSMNIEALAYDPTQKRLHIGFRSPIIEGKAVIVTLENPETTLAGTSPAKLSALIKLNLNGAGIRAMTFDDRLKGFVIISGSPAGAKAPFRLWLWQGANSEPRPLSVKGWDSTKHAEGIASVRMGQKSFLLVVCDDGSVNKNRGSSYTMIDYDDIQF